MPQSEINITHIRHRLALDMHTALCLVCVDLALDFANQRDLIVLGCDACIGLGVFKLCHLVTPLDPAPEERRWADVLVRIARDVADNVVPLMIEGVRKVPPI